MAKRITINPDGSYTPATILNGEEVALFVSEYKPGTDECEVELKVKFRKRPGAGVVQDLPEPAVPRTIKIGS